MELRDFFKRIDWLLVVFIVPIILSGLVTMKSFVSSEDTGNFFSKQIIKPNCREFFFVLFLINSAVNFDQIVRSLF